MYGGVEEYDLVADEEEEEEITQEDAWAVISAYFEEKGLVRQQLDSFDEFIQNTMQEIVDESADIEIRPESQHNPGRQSDFVEVGSCSNVFVFSCFQFGGFGCCNGVRRVVSVVLMVLLGMCRLSTRLALGKFI